MSDLPERIWVDDERPEGGMCYVYEVPTAGVLQWATPYVRADLSTSPEVVKELVEALRWYGEQARLARLIHSEGDAGRHAIDADGGKRARAVIAKLEGGE